MTKPKKKTGKIAEEVLETLVPDLLKIDNRLDILARDVKRLEKMLNRMDRYFSIEEDYKDLT